MSLVVSNPIAGAPSAVVLEFQCSAALAVSDTIVLVLPTWTLSGTAAPTQTGCGGSSTFTAAVASSGQADAAVTFTVATATLPAATMCTITTDAAMTTVAAAAQAANLATRTIAATIAAAEDVSATAIPTSTATGPQG